MCVTKAYNDSDKDILISGILTSNIIASDIVKQKTANQPCLSVVAILHVQKT
jgi:hypothetical protein